VPVLTCSPLEQKIGLVFRVVRPGKLDAAAVFLNRGSLEIAGCRRYRLDRLGGCAGDFAEDRLGNAEIPRAHLVRTMLESEPGTALKSDGAAGGVDAAAGVVTEAVLE